MAAVAVGVWSGRWGDAGQRRVPAACLHPPHKGHVSANTVRAVVGVVRDEKDAAGECPWREFRGNPCLLLPTGAEVGEGRALP